MNVEAKEPSIQDYIELALDILHRRKFLLVFSAPVLILIGFAVIMSLPPLYKASGTILIQDQEIPQDMIRSTVRDFAEQQIATTKQRIMTTARVTEIINKYGLYKDLQGKASLGEMRGNFKRNIGVKMISAQVPGKRRKANIAFTVSFTDKNPKKAQLVANELATLFLEENVKSRTGKADETAKFLEEEADRMQARVQDTENKIAEFKIEFGDSLPELLEYNLNAVSQHESQLVNYQEEKIAINEQLNVLNLQLSNTSPYLQFNNGGTTTRQKLVALKDELSRLLLDYSESHPDVKYVQHQIRITEDKLARESGSTNTEQADNPIYKQVQLQIDSAISELGRLEKKREKAEADLKDYKKRVSKTYQVKRAYDELTRDYDNKLFKYKELRAKQLQANIAQNMEAENKAGSFALIEPPSIPSQAEKPNRPKLMLMCIVMSIGFGLGLMVFFELIDPGVRGIHANRNILHEEPLAIIPHVYTKQDIEIKSKNRKILLMGVIIFSVLGLIVFHFFIYGLDQLWFKIATKLNLL